MAAAWIDHVPDVDGSLTALLAIQGEVVERGNDDVGEFRLNDFDAFHPLKVQEDAAPHRKDYAPTAPDVGAERSGGGDGRGEAGEQ